MDATTSIWGGVMISVGLELGHPPLQGADGHDLLHDRALDVRYLVLAHDIGVDVVADTIIFA